jgi:NSS family neurotransmitter:Na+ symporter
MDFLVANILLPLNALLIAVFAGWVMSRKSTLQELAWRDGFRYRYWRFILRFVAPVAVAIIFLSSFQ